jgi:hypothetical protein
MYVIEVKTDCFSKYRFHLSNTVRLKKKIELSVTKNFSWQFVKISIIRCQS